jgi:hypothetical protein
MLSKRRNEQDNLGSYNNKTNVEKVLKTCFDKTNEVFALEPLIVHSNSSNSFASCDLFRPKDASNSTWILDIGATQHVTGNVSTISNFKSMMVALMFATRGESHNVVGKGIVFIPPFFFPDHFTLAL